MGIQIPGELQWVSYLAGSKWPQGDETAMFRIAGYWETASKDLAQLIPEFEQVHSGVLEVLIGETGTAFDEQFRKLFSGDTSADKLAKAMEALGDAAKDTGRDIEHTKLIIITTLAITAAQILYALAMAFWTAGASLGWAALAEAGAIAAIRQIVARLIESIAAKIAAAAAETAVKELLWTGFKATLMGVTQGLGQELAVQQFQINEHHRDGFDKKQLGQAAAAGAAGGAGGALAGHGLGKVPGLSGGQTPLGQVVRDGLTGAGSGVVGNIAGGVASVPFGGKLSDAFSAQSLIGGAATGGVQGAAEGVRGAASTAGGQPHSGSGADPRGAGQSSTTADAPAGGQQHGGSDTSATGQRGGADGAQSGGGQGGPSGRPAGETGGPQTPAGHQTSGTTPGGGQSGHNGSAAVNDGGAQSSTAHTDGATTTQGTTTTQHVPATDSGATSAPAQGTGGTTATPAAPSAPTAASGTGSTPSGPAAAPAAPSHGQAGLSDSNSAGARQAAATSTSQPAGAPAARVSDSTAAPASATGGRESAVDVRGPRAAEAPESPVRPTPEGEHAVPRETQPTTRETQAPRETQPAAREGQPSARETQTPAREAQPTVRDQPAAREAQPPARDSQSPTRETAPRDGRSPAREAPPADSRLLPEAERSVSPVAEPTPRQEHPVSRDEHPAGQRDPAAAPAEHREVDRVANRETDGSTETPVRPASESGEHPPGKESGEQTVGDHDNGPGAPHDAAETPMVVAPVMPGAEHATTSGTHARAGGLTPRSRIAEPASTPRDRVAGEPVSDREPAARPTREEPSGDDNPPPAGPDGGGPDGPDGFDNPADHRTYGANELAPVENPAYQSLVESQLRQADGSFASGVDPRTNPYGRLINDGGVDVAGRDINCLDCSLSGLASFNGHPTVSAPRNLDFLPDGSLDSSGEKSGLPRAAQWLGDQLHLADPAMAIPDQFAALHDQVAKMGPGSSALVVNEWHARDPETGALRFNEDGAPVMQGSHATVVVYPHDATGPVWWDPQQGLTSDHPPAWMVNESARLWSTPIEADHFGATQPQQGAHHGGAGDQGTGTGLPGADLPESHLRGVRDGQGVGLHTDPESGGDGEQHVGGSEQHIGGPREDGDRLGDGNRDGISQLVGTDGGERSPGSETHRSSEGPSDLPTPVEDHDASTTGGSRDHHLPTDGVVAEESAGTRTGTSADDQQAHAGEGPDGHAVERGDVVRGVDQSAEPGDLARRGDDGVLAEDAAATRPAGEAGDAARRAGPDAEAPPDRSGTEPEPLAPEHHVTEAESDSVPPRYDEELAITFNEGQTENTFGKREEYERQIGRQIDGLNEMTANEWMHNVETVQRDGLAQEAAREEFSSHLYENELNRAYELEESRPEQLKGLTPEEYARQRTDERMSELAALHEPDIVAGGRDEIGVDPDGLPSMGDTYVNSSIGAQWQHRVGALRAYVEHMIATGHGGDRLNLVWELNESPTAVRESRGTNDRPAEPAGIDPREQTRPTPDEPSGDDNPPPSGPEDSGPDEPGGFDNPANHREYGPNRLAPLEDPAYQAAVERALRDPDGGHLIGADPRTNPYGGLINDGGPEVLGRDNNCNDTALAGLASFLGDPTVGVPRFEDRLPGGEIDKAGELGGLSRAEEWLGEGLYEFNGELSIPDQFAALHELVADMGPGSAAYVVNDWHALDDAGQPRYEADGTPVVDGSHASCIVYPLDASGPVWWDPQSGSTSDHPPESLVGESVLLRFTPIEPGHFASQQGVDHGTGHTRAGTGVSGADRLGPNVPDGPVRDGLGLHADSDRGGDRGGQGDRAGEGSDRLGNGRGDAVSELVGEHGDGGLQGGQADQPTRRPSDLSVPVENHDPAESGGSRDHHLPDGSTVADESAGTKPGASADDQQTDVPVRTDGHVVERGDVVRGVEESAEPRGLARGGNDGVVAEHPPSAEEPQRSVEDPASADSDHDVEPGHDGGPEPTRPDPVEAIMPVLERYGVSLEEFQAMQERAAVVGRDGLVNEFTTDQLRMMYEARMAHPHPGPGEVMQKVVGEPAVKSILDQVDNPGSAYGGGGPYKADDAGGCVSVASDAAGLRTPSEILRALRLDYGNGSPYERFTTTDHAYVIEGQLAKGSLSVPNGRITDHLGITDPHTKDLPSGDPPHTGTGYTGDPDGLNPEYQLDRGKWAPGAELIRIDPDGSRHPVARLEDNNTWVSAKEPGDRVVDGWPSHKGGEWVFPNSTQHGAHPDPPQGSGDPTHRGSDPDGEPPGTGPPIGPDADPAATARVFEGSAFDTEAGAAFFDPADAAMRSAAGDVPRVAGEFTVDVHGDAHAVSVVDAAGTEHRMSAREFAEVIRTNTGWDGQSPIRLLSCDTGAGPHPFAADLARELGVPVSAPDRPVWTFPDGREPVVTGFDRGPNGELTPRIPPDGRWNHFTSEGLPAERHRPADPTRVSEPAGPHPGPDDRTAMPRGGEDPERAARHDDPTSAAREDATESPHPGERRIDRVRELVDEFRENQAKSAGFDPADSGHPARHEPQDGLPPAGDREPLFDGSDLSAAERQALRDVWDGLSPDERRYLYSVEPMFGEHAALPVEVSDHYARQAAHDLRDCLISDIEMRRNINGDPMITHDELTRLRVLDNLLESVKQHDGQPPRFLLGFEHDGRSITSVGNPDTASHTVVFAPGTFTSHDTLNPYAERPGLKNWFGLKERFEKPGYMEVSRRIHQELTNELRHGDVAVVDYQNYHAPQSLVSPANGAPNARFAHEGAAELRNHCDRLQHTNHVGDHQLWVAGHSYGTVLVGEAAHGGHGLNADGIINLGSPGLRVADVSGLILKGQHLTPGDAPVHTMTRSDDPIRVVDKARQLHLDGLGIGHGLMPHHPEFGGHVWDVDGAPHRDPHNAYFDQGSGALRNIAEIVAGGEPPPQPPTPARGPSPVDGLPLPPAGDDGARPDGAGEPPTRTPETRQGQGEGPAEGARQPAEAVHEIDPGEAGRDIAAHADPEQARSIANEALWKRIPPVSPDEVQHHLADAAFGEQRAKDNAAWWRELSGEEQRALIDSYPREIGNAEGIPPWARTEANEHQLNRLHDDLQSRKDAGEHLSRGERKELQRYEKLQEALHDARSRAEQHGDEVHILAFDPSIFGGEGRMVVSIGHDPYHADSVSWHIPGLTTTIDSLGGNLTNAMHHLESVRMENPDLKAASIAWIGYDAPSGLGSWRVGFHGLARDGGDILHGDVAAFNAARDSIAGDGSHFSNNHLFGHSYGSTTTSYAGQHGRLGDEVRTITLLGSPGAGPQRHAGDFGIGDNVFVASSSRDPVTALGGRTPGSVFRLSPLDFASRAIDAYSKYQFANLGGNPNGFFFGFGLGVDPAMHGFEAQRITAEFPKAMDRLGSVGTHTAYYDYVSPGVRSESLANFGRIAAGHGDQVHPESHRTNQPVWNPGTAEPAQGRALRLDGDHGGEHSVSRRVWDPHWQSGHDMPATHGGDELGSGQHDPIRMGDNVVGHDGASRDQDGRCAHDANDILTTLTGRHVDLATEPSPTGIPARDLFEARDSAPHFSSYEQVHSELLRGGDGATALLVSKWAGDGEVGGHTYVARNDNGTVHLYERVGDRIVQSGWPPHWGEHAVDKTAVGYFDRHGNPLESLSGRHGELHAADEIGDVAGSRRPSPAEVQAALRDAPRDELGQPVDHRNGRPLTPDDERGRRTWVMRWDSREEHFVAENRSLEPAPPPDTFDPTQPVSYNSGDPYRPGEYMPDTDLGWQEINRGSSHQDWMDYQQQISGAPGTATGVPEYVGINPDTGMPVEYDGHTQRGDEEVFLEAKDGYAGIAARDSSPYWADRADRLVAQAERQLRALPDDAILEWHVSDPLGAAAIRELLIDNRMADIVVIYTPKL